MAAFIYGLCALTSLVCAVLLLRGYAKSRYRLLFWAGICFVGITLNNILVVLDKVVFPDVNLLTLRLVVTLIALALLLYGLIFND